MDEEQIVKDDWNTILGELDEIIRTANQFSLITMGDTGALEGEKLPALIHFINEIKKEKKTQSWAKIEHFNNIVRETLKFLDETQLVKLQGRRIDRSFIGVLPKSTNQLGTMAIEILNEIPVVLKIINDSVEAWLIDIKLKLGVSIVKFEKEILDIKHQIELLADDIESHTKLKKGLLSRSEGKVIYTQAYRETYHDILEKSKDYVLRDFRIQSKAFEHVFERFTAKINNYRESPAFDDFIRDNCDQIEETIATWLKDGFKAFSNAIKYFKKIDHRLSDTRQTFIKQIKADLLKETEDIGKSVEKLYDLQSSIDNPNFMKMKTAAERVISKVNFLIKTIDVVSEDPQDRLYNDENILLEAKTMASAAFNGTYGVYDEKLTAFVKQITPSKSSRELLEIIAETKGSCLEPNTLADILKVIPNLLEHSNTIDLLLQELAADLIDIQEKFVKKIRNVNKYFEGGDLVDLPKSSDLIKIDKVDLEDTKVLDQIVSLLKSSLAQTAKIISSFEEIFSEGLGISINPNLEGKISRYRRPSYKPTVKQANSAMNELTKFAKELLKDTGEAITEYVKDLKKFKVQTTALKTLQKLLRKIGKDAVGGKITLTQITKKLDLAIIEYAKELEEVLESYKDDLATIMDDMSDINIYDGMTLENFSRKHDQLLTNISLESVIQEQEKKEPEELKCRTCGGKIVSRREDYNDMLGLDVLLVKCENNHEDNIIGFVADEKEEEEVVEIKCAKCGSDTLTPTAINLFTKDALVLTAICPKNHRSEFNIKKK
ncbi:MAG: hypothetical protein FK733_04090 [Asgard group archaeon]|nr:hypothetical protein [Asgard group archaeon]